MHRRRGGPRPAALRSRAPFAALVGLATASALLVGACRSPGTADIGLPAPAGTHSPNGATGGNGSSPRASHEVIELVDDRGRRIDSFDAQLDLSLRRADGAAADLAGALRMARPDRFRLRSTKFGFLVCEVVMREGSAWAIMSPVVKDQARASAEATHDLLRVLGSLLGWRASGTGELAIVAEHEDRIEVEAIEPSGTRLRWSLARGDGRVLEVRRLDGDASIGVLRCSDHQVVGGVPIPTSLRFESETGRIDVRVRRPGINGPWPDDSFTAPDGAERIE